MAFSRQIVSIISASVLAAHVVVGCCAHHGHLFVGADRFTIAGHDAHHDHHGGHSCQHHAADSGTPSEGDKPCDHSCGEGACSFLAASKVILPDLAQPGTILAADATALLNQFAPVCIATDEPFNRAIIPPVRSHLSKCVLLI